MSANDEILAALRVAGYTEDDALDLIDRADREASERPGLRCGTYSAYSRHRQLGEPACRDCLDAKAAYTRAYVAKHRDHVNAQGKARSEAAAERWKGVDMTTPHGLAVVAQVAPMAKPDLRTLVWYAGWRGDGRLHLYQWTGSPCCGCGVNIHQAHEYYHVHNRVWSEAGACKRALYCIGCLEQRLGRQLCREDFSDAGINWHACYAYPKGTQRKRIRSARFMDRLARKGEEK